MILKVRNEHCNCSHQTHLTYPVCKGFDTKNRSAFCKEKMKTGEHHLAKQNSEIAADFGSSTFGALIKMSKPHSNIVRIFQDKETKWSCIVILKTPDGAKKSRMEQVGQEMGFNEKSNYHHSRPTRVANTLINLGFSHDV
jgi:hypothetical protein